MLDTKLEMAMRCFHFAKSVGQSESNPRFVSISCIITDHRWRRDCFKDQLLATYSPAWPMIQYLFNFFPSCSAVPSLLSFKFLLKQNRLTCRYQQKLCWTVQQTSVDKYKYFQLRQLYRTVKQLKKLYVRVSFISVRE